VHALTLKLQHAGGKAGCICLLAIAHLAYGKVLAKQAAQSAVGEKNRTRAPRPGNGRLLAPVDTGGGNFRLDPRPAETPFSPEPVHPAVMRAKVTMGKPFVGLSNSLQELT
jgi:hypothetical protein